MSSDDVSTGKFSMGTQIQQLVSLLCLTSMACTSQARVTFRLLTARVCLCVERHRCNVCPLTLSTNDKATLCTSVMNNSRFASHAIYLMPSAAFFPLVAVLATADSTSACSFDIGLVPLLLSALCYWYPSIKSHDNTANSNTEKLWIVKVNTNNNINYRKSKVILLQEQ